MIKCLKYLGRIKSNLIGGQITIYFQLCEILANVLQKAAGKDKVHYALTTNMKIHVTHLQ